jgi:hypothetical protein
MIIEYQIKPENIQNINQKGTLISCILRKYILILKEERNTFLRQDRGRE